MFYLANNEALNAKAYNGTDTLIAMMTATGEKWIAPKTAADSVVKVGCKPNGNGGLQIIDVGGGENASVLYDPAFVINANGEVVITAIDSAGVRTERKIATSAVS